MKNFAIVTLMVTILILLIIIQLDPLAFVMDDSLFYLKLAMNLSAGHGSTFNQILETNGYHPLWLLSLTLFTFFTKDPWVAFRLSIILSAMLLASSGWLLIKLLEECHIKVAYVSGLALIALLGTLGVYLSEAHLSALLLISLFYALVLAQKTENSRTHLLVGTIAGVSILARLDNIFIVTVIGIGYLLLLRNIKATILLGLSTLGIVLPYFGWNFVKFDHIMPISGAIHSSFPQISANFGVLGPVGWSLLVLAWAGVLALRQVPQSLRRAYLMFLLGSTLQALYVIFITSLGRSYHWYWVSFMILVAMGCSFVAQEIFRSRFALQISKRFLSNKVFLAFIIVIVTLVSTLPLALYRQHANNFNKIITAVRWLDELLGEDNIVALDDSPGIFGVWSRQKIIPIDGLMGDYAFQNMLIDKGIEETLRFYQVCYYVDTGGGIAVLERFPTSFPEDYPFFRLTFLSTLYDRPVGYMELLEENEVGRAWIGAPSLDHVIVWKLRDECH